MAYRKALLVDRPLRRYAVCLETERGLLGYRAVPTRCKYVHVSSRFSSLKTDGRHNPAPQTAHTLRATGRKTLSHSEFPPLRWDAPDTTV